MEMSDGNIVVLKNTVLLVIDIVDNDILCNHCYIVWRGTSSEDNTHKKVEAYTLEQEYFTVSK